MAINIYLRAVGGDYAEIGWNIKRGVMRGRRFHQSGHKECGFALLRLALELLEIKFFIHQQSERQGKVFLPFLPPGFELAYHLRNLSGYTI
jgi:hypothetical protein